MDQWLSHAKTKSKRVAPLDGECHIDEDGVVWSYKTSKKKRLRYRRRNWGPLPRTLLNAFYGPLPPHVCISQDPDRALHVDSLFILRKKELSYRISIATREGVRGPIWVARYTAGGKRRQKNFKTEASANEWRSTLERARLRCYREATRDRREALTLCKTICAFADLGGVPAALFDSLATEGL